MKLLVVDNGWILTGREGVVVEPRVGEFLCDCSALCDGTSYLCSCPSRSRDKYHGVALGCDAVHVIPIPARGANRLSRLLSYLCNFWVVWRAVRQADFLYVFFPGNVPLWSVAVSRFLCKPYGIYLRGELGRNTRWWRWAMSGARFVIAEGTMLADAARRFCDDVDLSIPLCPLPTAPARQAASFRTEGPWRFLYVGRLEERKGTLDLFEAMTLLQQRGVDFRLDLVGQNCLDRMPDSAARLGDRVHCAGVVTDDAVLGQYYRDADLFCFPSHDEGFPRVLYEAMAYGVPIVTTFVGSIASVLEDGKDCVRVDTRSPVALADAIECLLANPHQRKRLSDNGLATLEPVRRQWEQSSHAKQITSKITSNTSCSVLSLP